MRLIDERQLIRRISELPDLRTISTGTIGKIIKECTTIDAEPVRHGRWIHTTKEDSDWGGTFHRYTCSACNWSMGDNPTGWGLFCPNCGAKMDSEVQHA